MLDFEKRTLQFIKRHQLLERGDRIVAAVSGGPDSMAMLDFLVKRKEELGIWVAVAHVDHMLRGEESVRDMDYVRKYCGQHGLMLKAASIDIKEKMALDQKGMQETARTYRYRFFEKAMKELNADKLAVAQHGDDQIETILMRLTRGSSGKARAGIRPSRPFAGGAIIRPLLGATREQVEEYCKRHQLNPRMDPSNEKPDYTRNRFRLEVLPVLKKENPKVHEHFQRFSEDLLEDEAYLELLAEEKIKSAAKFAKDEIHLDIPSFLRMPLPLQRRGIHLILSYLYQEKIVHLTAWHAQLAEQLLRGENPSGKLDLPLGLNIIRSYDSCLFTFKNQEVKSQGFHHELDPGYTLSLSDGKTFRLEKLSGHDLSKSEDHLIFNGKDHKLPLVIRTRRPGDRIKLKGMNGTKKIKDLFIDEKIPLPKRETWPIIADQTGKILWVPGIRKSCYDISPPCKHEGQYVLYYTTLGGSKFNEK